MSLGGLILCQTGKSCQEITIGKFSLDDISGVYTIEDEGYTALVLEVVCGSTPVEFLIGHVLPVGVTLMLFAINEESLRPMRESWIIPRGVLLDDLFPRLVTQPCLFVWERISPLVFSLSG